MLKNYTPSKRERKYYYELVFDDGCGNGFAFPCDENGKPLASMNTYAHANYKYCMEHPERFARFNKVIKQEYTDYIDAHGICHCGNEVYLHNSYYGACQCEKCGQWYNLFGQEVLPPDEWDD